VADAGAEATYSWTISGGTLSSASAPSVSFTPSGSGPVTLTVTVSNPGCSITSSRTVAVNALPAATVTPLGATTFCQGGSVTLRASEGASYLWSNGATTRDITVSASGSYSVTVSDGTCSATSTATSVTVNPLPAATVTPLGSTTFCQGGSVTLRASEGASYLWSNGATTRDITVSASGSYSVAVSDGNCSATSTATAVTVNPLPPATIAVEGSLALCPNASVTLRAPAGYSYLWSNGATTEAITVTEGGNYTVRVSSATCSATSAPVTVTNLAATRIDTQPSNITILRNKTGQLSVTATAAGEPRYQWYSVNADGTSTAVANATQRTLTVGPYSRKGTHRFFVRVWSSTCADSVVTSNTVTVTVN
jgi:hypothetical protein